MFIKILGYRPKSQLKIQSLSVSPVDTTQHGSNIDLQ